MVSPPPGRPCLQRDVRKSRAARGRSEPWPGDRLVRILSPMAILDVLSADTREAMRARDKKRLGALRLLTSELQKAHKEGAQDDLAVLRRERKRRLEAASAYRQGGRTDLAADEEAEAELISGYLPAELSDSELQAIVEQAVRESGARSPQDMGRAMKQAMAAVDGRAEGKRVSGLVRATLGG
jgi:uncharacterized protein